MPDHHYAGLAFLQRTERITSLLPCGLMSNSATSQPSERQLYDAQSAWLTSVANTCLAFPQERSC